MPLSDRDWLMINGNFVLPPGGGDPARIVWIDRLTGGGSVLTPSATITTTSTTTPSPFILTTPTAPRPTPAEPELVSLRGSISNIRLLPRSHA